jgi:hypothetical protein
MDITHTSTNIFDLKEALKEAEAHNRLSRPFVHFSSSYARWKKQRSLKKSSLDFIVNTFLSHLLESIYYSEDNRLNSPVSPLLKLRHPA